MELKNYQEQLLDGLESFLARTRELKNPAAAFAESTEAAFGHALTYRGLPGAQGVPYICLRVPTGGGKTRLAGQAIARVNKAFLAAQYSLVLWLVPSDPIRSQTLRTLRTPGELLHEDMKSLFGSVHVLDIAEALYMQPSTLETANTIIVATMQSFKRDTADGLRVYRQNGALMSHFTDIPTEQRGEHSLVDVIRLRRPFVVVDEAHNQGTPLAVDTLLRLNPACILELTATPDRANQPSNVLRSVSAATLQAEDMLKLPLELATHAEWRTCLTEAIGRLRTLEAEATEEEKLTGEVIRPVMLIQAERHHAHSETFTPERVKKALLDDFHIPVESIAIATGAVDELGERRMTDANYPQFIITVDKLREGWDCPFAYVLFSFRNTTSATAVEQVLGRVLRMPHVLRKQREALNRSYAYVVSNELAETVKSLRDGFVQSGFERFETNALIQLSSGNGISDDIFTSQLEVTVPLPTVGSAIAFPDEDRVAALPKMLRDRIEFSPEAGTLTVRGGNLSGEQVKRIAEIFTAPEAATRVREQIDTAQAAQISPSQRVKTPAERGDKVRVPLLCFKQESFFDVFDETTLLDADWEITDFDAQLIPAEFASDADVMRRARLSISELEKIECDIYDRLDAQLALFEHESGWTDIDLIDWLDRNIHFPYSDRGQKVAWLNAAVTHLNNKRGFTIDELAYRKFRLRGALERKLADGLTLAKQRVFDGLFDTSELFDVSDEHAITLEQGRYAYDYAYSGLIPLKRHFFPIIGNLKADGEEFRCAEYIANQLPNLDWWVRNVEKKPGSFWLQTASDRFYPDFLLKLKSGELVAVEYKGSLLIDTADTLEKERVGKLWAARSSGRCKFTIVDTKNWNSLHSILSG